MDTQSRDSDNEAYLQFILSIKLYIKVDLLNYNKSPFFSVNMKEIKSIV